MKIAVIADIHSNLEALEAVLDRIKSEKIICAGDLVGYGASPNECVNLVRDIKAEGVLGNHDLAVTDLKKAFAFNPLALKAVYWTRKKLTKKNRQFLERLPESWENKELFMVHGSPQDPIREYVFPHQDLKAVTAGINQKVVVMGHTHVPFVKRINGRLVINPGSVGQPRDGNPKASYCELDIARMRARIVRVNYDISKAAQKIINAGLPKALGERLFTGG